MHTASNRILLVPGPLWKDDLHPFRSERLLHPAFRRRGHRAYSGRLPAPDPHPGRRHRDRTPPPVVGPASTYRRPGAPPGVVGGETSRVRIFALRPPLSVRSRKQKPYWIRHSAAANPSAARPLQLVQLLERLRRRRTPMGDRHRPGPGDSPRLLPSLFLLDQRRRSFSAPCSASLHFLDRRPDLADLHVQPHHSEIYDELSNRNKN